MIGIEDRVRISPATWPARAVVAPGDLTKFAPIGLGMSPPLVVMPWASLEDVLGRAGAYGALPHTGDPIRDAPVNEPNGGLIYFDEAADRKALVATLAFLGVSFGSKAYVVFAAESANPSADRYLAQIRIVRVDGMRLFGAVPDEGDVPRDQPIAIGSLIGVFMDAQRAAWGDGGLRRIGGTLGGDGDWASERLSFGFMVENVSNGVYRLWSRPWLVTK